ncbi:MAG: metabolite traffic protein EboE [Kofleriaceae bacterium]
MNVAGAHLTYCTNIHPGETWPEVRANLERHVVAVKQRVSPDAAFGVGLRLSGRAAHELAGEVAAVRRWLDDAGLYVFTINGFPHGAFHGTPVKEAVYRPDWLEPERVAYTNLLADLLVELLPDGVAGSISTVPGCFRARAGGDAGTQIAANLARCADHLVALESRTGTHLMLALEPEPACALETLAEAIDFFTAHRLDRRHIGLCLDTCHAAVEFEELAPTLAAIAAAGIPIAKLQLSAGMRIAPVTPAARTALARFTDGVYLHQTVARHASTLTRYVDLPEALADPRPADEWRVHFHVPIFRAELGMLASTQDFLAEVLAVQRATPISTHLEVETYTWDVLPGEFRDEPIADAIARELRWVLKQL